MKLDGRHFLLAIPVLVLLIIYAPTEHFFENQFDDAYVTYRYAINLAEGHGMIFNAGERTDAASSFLYTLLLSAFWFFGLKNLEFAGALIGVISLGVICAYVYKLAIYLASDRNLALFVAIACGMNGLLAGWTLSGMETLPWSAVVIVSIYLIATGARYWVTTLCITLAAFMRVEGVLLFIPYVLTLPLRGNWRNEGFAIGAATLLLCLFYIAKHEYYGVWISHALKMKELANYYKPAPKQLFLYWWHYVSVPLVLGFYALTRKHHWPVLVYIAISTLSLLIGPRSDWSRYSLHLLPLFYAYSVIALMEIKSIAHQAKGRILLIIIILVMCIQSFKGEVFNWKNMTALADHQRCRKNIGAFISAKIPADEYIASADLGGASYLARNHRFVDLIGLTSSDILASYAQGKNADEILEAKNVKYTTNIFYPGKDGTKTIDNLLAQFPGIHQKSKFFVAADKPLYQCLSADGLTFQLTTIERK